jgi:hypothetical protein
MVARAARWQPRRMALPAPKTLLAWLVTAAALLAAVVAAPAAADARPATPPRGTLLHARRVATLSPAQIRRHLRALRLPGAPPHLRLPPGPVRFGVDAYRVGYATVGAAAEATTATGLVLIPRRRATRLRTVSYAHGTLAARSDAPSRSLDSLGGGSALLFGGAGYATVAPDYLGLGDGPGRHPYMQLATEQSASLDLLRAARTLAARHAHNLERRVLVTGFSQGAVAAMGLARQLQDGADARFELGALAPISGPFAVQRDEVPGCLTGRLDPVDCTYYVSYLAVAWQPLYHVFATPTDVWRGHWAHDVPALFNGRHDDVAIIKALPRRLSQLFTAGFLRRLEHPDGGLLTGMQQTDQACAWAPRAPTRLYAASADEQVIEANSRHCLDDLRAHGARPHLRVIGRSVVGGTGHFGSALAATPRVLTWFDRLTTHGPLRTSARGPVRAPRSGSGARR